MTKESRGYSFVIFFLTYLGLGLKIWHYYPHLTCLKYICTWSLGPLRTNLSVGVPASMDWCMTNCCYPQQTLRWALTAVKPSGSLSSSSSAHLSLSPHDICISKSLWTSSPAPCISPSDSNQMVLVLWLQQRLLPAFISRIMQFGLDCVHTHLHIWTRLQFKVGRGWWCSVLWFLLMIYIWCRVKEVVWGNWMERHHQCASETY